MWTISKTFTFSAAHSLSHLNKEHPCSNLHGHNYEITFFLRSDSLDDYLFVQDYHSFDPIKNWIDRVLDHHNLNDVFTTPTVEFMSKVIFDYFKPDYPLLFAVEMSETPRTKCRYEESKD